MKKIISNYSKNLKCKCGNPISNHAKRCRNCVAKYFSKLMSGKNNPFYGRIHTKKTRRLIKLHHVVLRGKNSPSYGIKRPDLSDRNRKNHQIGKDNPNFGNHKLAGKNNPNYGKRYEGTKKIDEHHVDLNHGNSKRKNILYLSASKHIKLHQRAYEYLVRIGKIRDYLRWFDKKYKLEIKKHA